MSIFANVLDRMGFTPKVNVRRSYARGWSAANQDRLTNDWQTTSLSADGEVTGGKRKIIVARSRDLWMNNDYAKRYIDMVSTNVVGPDGVVLQNKAYDIPPTVKQKGKLDEWANYLIEDAFWRWGEKYCDVTGTLSWLDLQRLTAETAARDGEIFIRKIKSFQNPFKFAIQVLETDYCPDDLNVLELPNGNRIVMGVELNKWGQPVAYYFTARHPGDSEYLYYLDKYLRIPAEEIDHIFLKTRPGQTRGIPWLAVAMTRLKMLGAYEEAEVIAARVAACKMGFFQSEPPEIGTGKAYKGDAKDSDNTPITEAEPGILEELPPGLKFQAWDPQHPNSNFGIFMKSVLRGVASGLGVSYNTLANDLESTSYSSGRIGVLDERDSWRKIQRWFVSALHQKIFEPWLEMALLTSQIPLPVSKMDKFNQATWHPRGFDWVDPQKDATATIESINFGLKTRTQALAEKGLDLNEHFAQLAEEKQLAEQYGLEFIAPGQKTQPTDQPPAAQE